MRERVAAVGALSLAALLAMLPPDLVRGVELQRMCSRCQRRRLQRREGWTYCRQCGHVERQVRRA